MVEVSLRIEPVGPQRQRGKRRSIQVVELGDQWRGDTQLRSRAVQMRLVQYALLQR